MTLLDPDRLERFDSLFVAPHGDDVPLSCPARVRAEADRGRPTAWVTSENVLYRAWNFLKFWLYRHLDFLKFAYIGGSIF